MGKYTYLDYRFTLDFWNKFYSVADHYYKCFDLLQELKLSGYLDFFKNIDLSNCLVLKTDLYVEAKNIKDNFLPFVKIDKCVGMDISFEVVRAASRNLVTSVPKMQFVVADVRNLPFKNDSFNAIISDSTLDHLPVNTLPVLLLGLRGILKEKGKLILSLNNKLNFSVALYRIIANLNNYYISFSFNRLHVASLLINYSFKIINWDYIIPLDYLGVFLAKYSKVNKLINFMVLYWLAILKKISKVTYLKRFVCIHFITLAEKS